MTKWSIKKKIVTYYVSAVVVIITIFGVYTSVSSDQFFRKNAIRTYQNTANQFASNIQNEINNYGNYSFLIAQNASLVNLLSTPLDIYDTVYLLNTSIEPNIVFFLNNYELIKDIRIFKEVKKNIPSRFFLDNNAVKSLKWYTNTINQYGAYWYFKENNLHITKSIQSFNDTVILGVIDLNIDFNQLFHDVINDRDLKIIVKSGESIIYSDKTEDDLVELLNYTITGTDLTLGFYTSNSNVRPEFMQTYGIPFVIVLSCILLSALLMWTFFRHMSLRIDSIITSITAIEEKDFVISLPTGNPDELGALAACLNTMSEKIQHLIKEIGIVKDQEKQAEIDALQAKITPHFLYNIMDTINWYALDGDSEAICNITKNLALYYRTNLNGGQTMTTVFKEIQNIKAYLSLQQRLTDNGFDVVFELQDNLNNHSVCNFILQPLVENSIKHGITLLTEQRGCITVRVFQKVQQLYFEIEDNGVGIKEDQIQSLLYDNGGSYGLKNVQERIQMIFGNEYGLSLHSTPGAGTKVTICLPLILNQTMGTD